MPGQKSGPSAKDGVYETVRDDMASKETCELNSVLRHH
jgi:hypothetical protein